MRERRRVIGMRAVVRRERSGSLRGLAEWMARRLDRYSIPKSRGILVL